MGFWKREQSEPPKAAEAPLKPGTCECEHSRSSHDGGKGKCRVGYPPDKEWPNGAECSCQIFILDDDNDNSDSPEAPIDPEVVELERMVK